jgi:hypothetical protein
VKQRLVLLAWLALGFSASPALAFKNIAGCDIVAFAAPSSPVPIAAERWQAYRANSELLLSQSQSAAATDWRGLAASLIGAQNSMFAPEKGSKAYQDYLASDNCRVLAKLDSGAIETMLGAVSQSVQATTSAALARRSTGSSVRRASAPARTRRSSRRTIIVSSPARSWRSCRLSGNRRSRLRVLETPSVAKRPEGQSSSLRTARARRSKRNKN